jgi:hypothetical protein
MVGLPEFVITSLRRFDGMAIARFEGHQLTGRYLVNSQEVRCMSCSDGSSRGRPGMASPDNQSNNGRWQAVKKRKKRIADKTAGNLCIFYLLLMLAFLSWQLFDTWISRYSLLTSIGYGLQRQQTLRLIAFTLIAGALGGVVNGLRSGLRYHQTFDRRHTWKYVCAPWMGAMLALFVYALLRSSISVLGGNPGGNLGNTQVLSNFSVGALVGYGSKDVFVWLDNKVTKFFQVPPQSNAVKPAKGASSSPAKHGRRNGTANHDVPIESLMHRQDSVPITMSSTGKAN